jgi:Flp pilus assembly protein TadB
MYYHSDSSVFDDEDSSVCGVVYITSEGGAYQPKPSQNKVLQQQNEPRAGTTQHKNSSKRLLVGVACAVGMVVLLALSIGIAVGAPNNVLPPLLHDSYSFY